MTLEQFQELAPVTVNDLSISISPGWMSDEDNKILDRAGKDRNIAHMSQGMSGELSEILIAMYKKDAPNYLEEITDLKWFVVVFAWMKGIKLSQAVLDMHEYFGEAAKEFDGIVTEFELLQITVGTLTDVIKRESCYGVAKYQKQEITISTLTFLIYDVLAAADWLWMCTGEKFTLEDGYDRVIEKLHKVRYANADGSVGFSTEAATNRDLEAEKKSINNQ